MEAAAKAILKIDKANWTPVKFGDVVFEPKENAKDIYNEGIEHVVGLEHIEAENIHLTQSGKLEESTTFSKKFKKGDVLFGRRRAYLKKAALASFDGICSGDITVFRAKKNLLPKLLPFIVNNEKFFDYAVKHSAGGLSPRVKFKDLANYEFLLPPKDQQAQLAELLWAMDEVIEKTESIRGLLYTIRKTILKDLFNLNWSSGSPFFNTFSIEDFNLLEFSQICSESMFGPRFSSKYYNEKGGIACLRTTDIDEEGNINVRTMPHAKLPEGKFKEHYLRINDILISRSGTCGLTAVFNGYELPVLPAAFIIRFRLKEEINPNYIKTFFNSEYGKTITNSLASGAVQKNLTSKALLKVKIPIPKKSIQDQIIIMLENLGLEESEIKISSSRALQKSLINQIF